MKKKRLCFLMAAIFLVQILAASVSIATLDIPLNMATANDKPLLLNTNFNDALAARPRACISPCSPLFDCQIKPNQISLPSRDVATSL